MRRWVSVENLELRGFSFCVNDYFAKIITNFDMCKEQTKNPINKLMFTNYNRIFA